MINVAAASKTGTVCKLLSFWENLNVVNKVDAASNVPAKNNGRTGHFCVNFKYGYLKLRHGTLKQLSGKSCKNSKVQESISRVFLAKVVFLCSHCACKKYVVLFPRMCQNQGKQSFNTEVVWDNTLVKWTVSFSTEFTE